jgi:2-polyprenyl-3-methyl-5-hydroxy-6-metoxy-1,4-benzoquinol methylase
MSTASRDRCQPLHNTEGSTLEKFELWKPTKFRVDGNKVRASKDRNELAVHSRIVAELVAEFYTRAIHNWASGELADLGCGKAPLMGAYRQHCSSVFLADWANSLHENPLLDQVVDLGQPLTMLQSNTFDTVILSDVLEHIAEPAQLMMEISRILKPNGHLIMNVPFLYWIHEAPHDYYRYTNYALERFATQAGLEVVELARLGGWIEVNADLWSKFLVRAHLSPVVAVIQNLVVAFHRTALGRKVAAKSSAFTPIGYGMVARKKDSA